MPTNSVPTNSVPTNSGAVITAPGVDPGGGRHIGRYVALTAVAFIILFPVYAALIVALKPLSELRDLGMLLPTNLELSNFSKAFTDAHMGRYLINSAIVSTFIMVGQVLTSIAAGYAFAFLRIPLKAVIFLLFLATLMVPTEVTIVANFETIQNFGWVDTYEALIVPFLAFAFGTFMMRQAFLGIPSELRDAARMDGYGHWGFMTRVAIPLVRPSIAALSVFSFLLAWNQYLWPLLVTNDPDVRTVQIGLKQLAGDAAGASSLPVQMAGTIIAALPIILMIIFFERHLIRGLTSGAVKG
jgi:sn-glycerol 3-phosphate transport system permease protein